MEEQDGKYKDDIYSNAVRAGSRTYFFDVKSTKGGDFYITITESRKNYNQDGSSNFQKHKLFLYKEDFKKFGDGFNDVVNKITELNSNNLETSTDEVSED